MSTVEKNIHRVYISFHWGLAGKGQTAVSNGELSNRGWNDDLLISSRKWAVLPVKTRPLGEMGVLIQGEEGHSPCPEQTEFSPTELTRPPEVPLSRVSSEETQSTVTGTKAGLQAWAVFLKGF